MGTFDHLNERALGWLARIDPTRREILQATLFLLVLFIVGMVGYRLIEGWPLMDGLYMTFITLTTIGFTEVHTLTRAGRLFTMVIGITGIGSVAFIATRTAQLLLTTQRIRQRHMERKIDRVRNHLILCGYGRIGKRIAQNLAQEAQSFVVIEKDAAEIEMMRNTDLLYVEGDAEEEEVLRQAGIERARMLILTLPEDSANVFVTLTAQEIVKDTNRDLQVLVRTNDHKNRRKILHAGADYVLAPNEIGADRMSQVILRPHVDRFMEHVLHTGALGLLMDEVHVQEQAPIAGNTLAESNFRQQFDAIVIGIVDAQTQEMQFNPSPEFVIKPGDVLIVLGNQEMISRLREEGCQPR